MDRKEQKMDTRMSKKDEKKMKRELLMFIGFIFLVAGILVFLVLVVFNKPAHGAEKKTASGSFLVRGYESKKYAIDDDKMRQINSGISIIQKGTAKLSGGILKTLVYGSADKTGPSDENDSLSDNRAKPVAAILKDRLPQGSFVEVVPLGDSKNARQVCVEWKYVSATSAIFSTRVWITGYIVIILLIAGAVFLFFKKVVSKKIVNVLAKTAPQPGFQWVNLEVKGEKYVVKTEFKDGKFISPFKSRKGYEIIRDDRGIIDSLKGCLVKDEFSQQKEELTRQGTIERK